MPIRAAQGTTRGTTKSSTCASGCPTLTGAVTYDGNGFIATSTDLNGNITAFTHNPLGEVTSRTSALGTPQARTYNVAWSPSLHRPTQITFPDKSLNYSYDPHGNLLTRTITAGGVTRSLETCAPCGAARGDSRQP